MRRRTLTSAIAAIALCACKEVGPDPDPTVAYPEFGDEAAVTIAGYDGDAMEPFITSDGRFLFFNSLNDAQTTSLYYATRQSDTVFIFQGEIAGVNGRPPHLDAVASMDENRNFYFVTTRDYPSEIRNLLKGRFSDGVVSRIEPVDGDFYIRSPAGWLVMDAEISLDGERLFFASARFTGQALPAEARLVLARRQGEVFTKDPSSDALFSRVNGSDYLVYAPSTTFTGGELYFTRLRKGTFSTEICVSVRSEVDGAYSVPKRLAIEGDAVEAPTLTRDGSRMYYHRKLKSEGRYHVFTMTRRAAQAHAATALQ